MPRSYTIIDEADEMLHPDWEEDMAKIMSGGGKQNNLAPVKQPLLILYRYQRRWRSSLPSLLCDIQKGHAQAGSPISLQ